MHEERAEKRQKGEEGSEVRVTRARSAQVGKQGDRKEADSIAAASPCLRCLHYGAQCRMRVGDLSKACIECKLNRARCMQGRQVGNKRPKTGEEPEKVEEFGQVSNEDFMRDMRTETVRKASISTAKRSQLTRTMSTMAGPSSKVPATSGRAAETEEEAWSDEEEEGEAMEELTKNLQQLAMSFADIGHTVCDNAAIAAEERKELAWRVEGLRGVVEYELKELRKAVEKVFDTAVAVVHARSAL